MAAPKISVVIPTRNRAKYIAETLDCILNQSLAPYEVIVVDNGSEDETVDLLESKYKETVILIKNKGNYSPGAGRNLGLKVATGDYIQFFDSDDLMTSNKFESQVELLNNSSSEAVYSPYVMAKWQNEWQQCDVVLHYYKFPSNKSWTKEMTKGFFIPLPAFLFKMDFVKSVGFWRDDIFAYEDFDYLFRMAQIGFNPMHTNSCCTFYRVHNNQITGNMFNNEKRDKDKVICFSNLLSKFKKNMSTAEQNNLKTMIHRVEKQTNITGISSFTFKKNDFLLRLYSKIGRMRTSTDWTPIYGPTKDVSIFEKYKKLL